MINKIIIKEGALKKVLGKKTIKFSPDVNVVWGKNGVGKSLILKTIANYNFIDLVGGGGWSKKSKIGFEFSYYDFKYKTKNKNLSDAYEFDKNSKIDIDWSGCPSFYIHHDDMIDLTHIMGYEMSGSEWISGIGKIMDIIKEYNYHPSTGQLLSGIVRRLLELNPPNLLLESNNYSRSDLKSYVEQRREVFVGTFKPTLLLDEVDSQLDLFNQIWFHKEVVPKLKEKFQIIMVSHSVFAAMYYKNIIDLDGSLENVKKEMKRLCS